MASKPMVVSLDMSFGTSSLYDLHVCVLETHLFQVESPTLWSKVVFCTLLFHAVCAFIL
jgi:hypothetical protein